MKNQVLAGYLVLVVRQDLPARDTICVSQREISHLAAVMYAHQEARKDDVIRVTVIDMATGQTILRYEFEPEGT